MKRREWLQRSAALGTWAARPIALTSGAAATALLAACGGGGNGEQVSSDSGYRQTNLVANKASYEPLILQPDLVDAWGIAIRPAGAGGHFWVTGMGKSFEYVGDVNGTPLHVDNLDVIDLPASGENVGAANGVVFNSGAHFVITQQHANGAITAPAKFIFVSDNGVLSAWTERLNQDGTYDRSGVADLIVDDGASGSAFFGVAIAPTFDKLFVVDFGVNPHPRIRVFGSDFSEEDVGARFANPFSSASGFQIGDLVPFNIQTIRYRDTTSVFVAYVNTQEDPDNPGRLLAATESSGRGRGRLVEYSPAGQLIAVWDDRGALNGPWGVAVAPANFGTFSNQLLVSNFSDGTIVGFDTATKRATEYMRDAAGNVLKIAGLWNILFGNGVSLGDSNALYFAAGPADETDGLFGSLRPL
ncbi:TIGR03118 family protein [soil metagenome]